MGNSFPLMMILMFGVFYFVLIRPQQKKFKEHQAMLGALKKGDMVVTRGGIIGKVTGVTGTELVLELQEKVRVRVLRSFVESKHVEAAPAGAADDAAKAA